MANNRMATGSTLQVIAGKPLATKAKVPPMPRSLPAELKTDYLTLIRSLIAAGTWRTNLMPSVETYLTALLMLREATAALVRDGHYFTDDHGLPKAHPAATAISKATAALNTGARLLGINVASAEPMAKTKPEEATTPAPSKWSLPK